VLVRVVFTFFLAVFPATSASGQTLSTITVRVRHDATAVVGATVVAGGVTRVTDAAGQAVLSLPPGSVELRVSKPDFLTVERTVVVGAAAEIVEIQLEDAITVEEEVIVVASTRTGRRLEDEPLRVEVVPHEEVQEKLMMAPGDISMLLNETNGLRVQSSPSLGGANVRIQGLRGRYSQILSDGLLLFGAQTGSIGILQIPPMDLGQVEVIKGVASALYGMSAVGGVVNLVSRRPPDAGHEGEVLVNATSHRGVDVVPWLAGTLTARTKYTFVGGLHAQQRSDLDRDGWTDLPSYRRAVARPRLFWEDGAGRSFLGTVGVMSERRDGGTMPGQRAPDGRAFEEAVETTRVDAGAVGRVVTARSFVVAGRASVTSERTDRTYGLVGERDRHGVLFGEVSVTGATGAHMWVVGSAVTRDRLRATDVPRFNYTYTTAGAFVQDDYSPTEAITVSGGARVDVHNEFGTFVSPRVSLLVRPADEWSVRVTTGRGHFAPSVFTEETEATGLTPVAPLGDARAERARSTSADVTWRPGPFELTLTAFRSRVDRALVFGDAPAGSPFAVIVETADGPVRTHGTEFIARYHREGFDIVATHMWLRSTEPNPFALGRRQVPLNPGHSASFDLLRQIGPARIGFEVFYTGSQALEENPYRVRGKGHTLVGGLVDLAVGRHRVFINFENLGNVRQTRFEPLVRPVRDDDGRWTVDAWAPLEGRTVNAGLRLRF
jgi:outer membrane receptor for ferrienterochelin and colicins